MAPTQQIIQGTWDEIAARADELRGRRLTLIVAEERPEGASVPPPVDEKGAALLAYLNERLKSALTDPEEIREAEAEQARLAESLNRNRVEAGERPLFPE
jgi:hypothetical protein